MPRIGDHASSMTQDSWSQGLSYTIAWLRAACTRKNELIVPAKGLLVKKPLYTTFSRKYEAELRVKHPSFGPIPLISFVDPP
jgi:hypothetical protein